MFGTIREGQYGVLRAVKGGIRYRFILYFVPSGMNIATAIDVILASSGRTKTTGRRLLRLFVTSRNSLQLFTSENTTTCLYLVLVNAIRKVVKMLPV
jgi:hypothetical protein